MFGSRVAVRGAHAHASHPRPGHHDLPQIGDLMAVVGVGVRFFEKQGILSGGVELKGGLSDVMVDVSDEVGCPSRLLFTLPRWV
jgi:hypothetical protein